MSMAGTNVRTWIPPQGSQKKNWVQFKSCWVRYIPDLTIRFNQRTLYIATTFSILICNSTKQYCDKSSINTYSQHYMKVTLLRIWHYWAHDGGQQNGGCFSSRHKTNPDLISTLIFCLLWFDLPSFFGVVRSFGRREGKPIFFWVLAWADKSTISVSLLFMDHAFLPQQCDTAWLLHKETKRHVNVPSCFLIIFQYQPISFDWVL